MNDIVNVNVNLEDLVNLQEKVKDDLVTMGGVSYVYVKKDKDTSQVVIKKGDEKIPLEYFNPLCAFNR